VKENEESYRFMRIDVHSHMYPPEYVKGLADANITGSLGFRLPEWSVEKLLAQMDDNGVEATIVSTSTPGASVGDVKASRAIARVCNDAAARMISDHPQRLGAFATLPLPDVEGSVSEIEYALGTLKLDGVGLMTNYDLKYLGDPAFEEVFRALNRWKAVVHVHPGNPPGQKFAVSGALMDAPFDTTRAITSLVCSGTAERYPNISYIMSHGGGAMPYLAFRIGEGVEFQWKGTPENVPKGFYYYLKRMYYDTALVGSYALPSLKALAGTSKILFSTGYPIPPPHIIKKAIDELEAYEGLDAAARRAIDRDNALALFPRFGTKM
jgi:6-methylsalicylate decarboxylase